MKTGRLLGIIALLLVACSRPEPVDDTMVFRYNEPANITSLDPAFARDQAIIWATHQLFNGLVQLDSQSLVKPCIARDWKISDDALTYSFRLRDDVYFHDSPVFPGGKGRRVVARDVVYSLNRLVDPSVASPGSWVLNSVERINGQLSVSASGDSVVRIRLSEPFPPFLSLLSMQYCSVVPFEATEYFGTGFRKNPVGTGPFRFKFWQEGVKLVMVRNPVYFETEGESRLPYLEAVAISFIPDRQTVFLSFLQGKFDFLSGIDAAYKDELLTRDGQLQPKYNDRIKLATQPYLNTEYLGFMVDPRKNNHKHLLSKYVRQAMNYAFDREKMISYLRNNIGTPGTGGIIPKGLPSFDTGTVYYSFDPEKAKALLARAGFPGGRGLPPIELSTTPDYLDICKYIQHQVAGIGIDLKIEVGTPAAIKEMKAEARLGFFRASWIADYPDGENYLSMFVSRNFCPQGPNYTHFSDSIFDSLYQKSMQTVDPEERIMLYRKMESLMMSEAPVIILYYDQILRFTQNNIEGLGSNPMNLLTLKYVKKRPINHRKPA
jgi:peptide/nickel transport system substrate-binding protein